MTTPPPSPANTLRLKSCMKALKPCLRQQGVPVVSSPNTRRRKQKRRVAFGRLEINEHPSIMGDNPSVSDGCPLAIGWNRRRHTVFDVQYYETYNPSEQRRSKSQLLLGVAERSASLISLLFIVFACSCSYCSGFSMLDIP